MDYLIEVKSQETTKEQIEPVLYDVVVKTDEEIVGEIVTYSCIGESFGYGDFECLIDEDYFQWSKHVERAFAEPFPEEYHPVLLIDSCNIEDVYTLDFYKMLETATYNIFAYCRECVLVIIKANNETQKKLIKELNDNKNIKYIMSENKHRFYCTTMS